MSVGTCDNCQYWDRASTIGYCRRHAPQANDVVPRWPMTSNCDWCGEFKPKSLGPHFVNVRRPSAPADADHWKGGVR